MQCEHCGVDPDIVAERLMQARERVNDLELELMELRKSELDRKMEVLRDLRSPSPPYVFPDRRPTKYDATARGEVWVVCGSLHTDGTGWRWDMTQADGLVAGDIWVPIYLLHLESIPEVAERARELTCKPAFANTTMPDEPQ